MVQMVETCKQGWLYQKLPTKRTKELLQRLVAALDSLDPPARFLLSQALKPHTWETAVAAIKSRLTDLRVHRGPKDQDIEYLLGVECLVRHWEETHKGSPLTDSGDCGFENFRIRPRKSPTSTIPPARPRHRSPLRQRAVRLNRRILTNYPQLFPFIDAFTFASSNAKGFPMADNERLLTRSESVEFIKDELGVPMTPSRFDKDSMAGRAPKPAAYYGRRQLYRRDDLLVYGRSLLTPEAVRLKGSRRGHLDVKSDRGA